MQIRLLRAFFTLTTLAVVWLVATPALALSDPEPARVRELSGGIGGLPRSLSDPEPARGREPLTSAPMSASMSTMPAAPVDNTVPPTSRAPLCDPRGATTFAPPPQMQDVEVSLDTGLTLDDCATSTSSRAGHRAAPGRTPLPLDPKGSSDAAVIMAVATLAVAARERLPVPVVGTMCPRPGIRSTVDRPPRA